MRKAAKDAHRTILPEIKLVKVMRNRIFSTFILVFTAVASPFVSMAAPAFDEYLSPSFCRSKTCAFIESGPRISPLWIRVQASVDYPAGGALGKWRLVRTPGPEKNGDVVSIMHTADALQSDPEFAGMLIRCRPKSALQIAFVLITPFRPRIHPKITVAVNHMSTPFQGEVIPPGSMVALPNEAEVLARGPWQSANQLTVDIEGDGAKIHGIVSLENLSRAIGFLQANCPAQ